MTGMVERVARAMCEADGFKWDAAHFNETGNGDEPEEQREYWRDKARAAIEAMREPTDAMVKAGVDDILEGPGIGAFLNWPHLVASRWRLQVDAALQEGKQGE